MSTFTSWAVKSREDLKTWILRKLGHPLIKIELTDDQLEMSIDDALEEFNRYYQYDTNYFGTELQNYEYYEGETDTLSGQIEEAKFDEGITLPPNVASVVNIYETLSGMAGGINDLFSMQNTMLNMGMMPDFHSIHKTGGWVNYHVAMESIELTKKMTGGGFQFDYNEVTRKLKLSPNPTKRKMKGYLTIECQTVRPEEQNVGQSIVKRLSLAEAKITLGQIRSKFAISLVGGGTLDTGVLDQGISEREAIVEELRNEMNTFNFWLG